MAQVANLRQQRKTLWHKLETCASKGWYGKCWKLASAKNLFPCQLK